SLTQGSFNQDYHDCKTSNGVVGVVILITDNRSFEHQQRPKSLKIYFLFPVIERRDSALVVNLTTARTEGTAMRCVSLRSLWLERINHRLHKGARRLSAMLHN